MSFGLFTSWSFRYLRARYLPNGQNLSRNCALGQNVPARSEKVSYRARRPYPQVFPKYKNPAQPSETWSGRGKQPHWLTAELRSGKKLDDFRIVRPMSIRRDTTRKVVATKTKGRRRRSALFRQSIWRKGEIAVAAQE